MKLRSLILSAAACTALATARADRHEVTDTVARQVGYSAGNVPYLDSGARLPKAILPVTGLPSLAFGDTTTTGTATPINLNLGGTYSSTHGVNPKVVLYDNGTVQYGMGVSAAQMDFMVPSTAMYVWYINGVEKLRLNPSGVLVGDGSGLTGITASAVGAEYPLTFNAPITRASNTISMAAADATHNGYLSSTDWSTFNSKLSSVAFNVPTSFFTGAATSAGVITLGLSSGVAAHAMLIGPTSGTGTPTVRVPSLSEFTNDVPYVSDALGVHKAGTETITGAKTFSARTDFPSSYVDASGNFHTTAAVWSDQGSANGYALADRTTSSTWLQYAAGDKLNWYGSGVNGHGGASLASLDQWGVYTPVDYMIGTSGAAAPQVVFVGDSLTFGYTGGTAAPPSGYVTLSAWNGQTPAKVNIGYNGRQGAEMLHSTFASGTTANLNTQFNQNTALNIAVVMGGTNDIGSIGNKTPQQTYSLLAAYCDHLRALGWKVVVCTLPSGGGAGGSGAGGSYDTARATFNALITANWQRFADALADVGANATIGAAGTYTNTTYFNADQIHLQPAGYAIVGSVEQTAINTLISDYNNGVRRARSFTSGPASSNTGYSFFDQTNNSVGWVLYSPNGYASLWNSTSGDTLKAFTSGGVNIGGPGDPGAGNLTIGNKGTDVAFAVQTGNGTAGKDARLDFWTTFGSGVGDTTQRRMGRIETGYDSGGAWGSEFLAFGVGYGNAASNDAANPPTERMRIMRGVNVGGTSDPGAGYLQVANGVALGGGSFTPGQGALGLGTHVAKGGVIWFGNDATRYMQYDSGSGVYGLYNASLYVNGTTYASSRQLKTNIRDWTPATASPVQRLRPRIYDRTDSGAKNELSFVAEEVREVLPEAVEDMPTDPRNHPGKRTPGIKVMAIVAAEAAEIQALRKEVEELKAMAGKAEAVQR